MSVADLVRKSKFHYREAAGGKMYWLTFDGASNIIELAAFEDRGRLRLLFRFGERAVDTSEELLVYYLQLNSDMSMFRLHLAENERLYLSASYSVGALDLAGFEWLVSEFGQACDYLYPDLLDEQE